MRREASDSDSDSDGIGGSRGFRAGLGVRLAVAAALVALVVAVAPRLAASPDGLYLAGRPGEPPFGNMCWLRELTGLHCPMCGMLRSLVALLHGDLGAAMALHPAGPIMAAALAGAFVAAVAGRGRAVVVRLLEVGSYVAIVSGVVRWVI